MAAVDNEFIHEGDDIIVNTKLIGGGESVTIYFDVPSMDVYVVFWVIMQL